MNKAMREGLKTVKRHAVRMARKVVSLPGDGLDPFNPEDYKLWIQYVEDGSEYKDLKYQPLISVLIPVYNVKGEYLRKCLDSVLAQKYTNFEIILVDDASTDRSTLQVLQEYKKNEKIKLKQRKKNGHISKATNDALKLARGEFVALMDNDDTIPENALYEVVKALNDDKKLDFIYTDEDKIDVNDNRYDPHFKPDWSPDTFLSLNYISHFGVIRKALVDEAGGLREGYEGAQDYDLYLRVLEKTKRIHHIPRILYHWRAVPESTAMKITNKDYAVERGKKALQDAMKRRGIKAEVKIAENVPYYYLKYELTKKPLISIIIPTRDAAKMTRRCLESVFKKTTYDNFEVIVVNNNSEREETFALFDEYAKKYENFKVIDAKFAFNYAKINNLAVKESKGDYLVLLNNDTEIITPEWLEIMLGYAMQKHVGTVGPQLLYGDNTVQHAGTVLGLGVASHVFVGYPTDAIVWGGRLSVPYNYSAITAACMMVSRRHWDEVGGMEEKLKVAYNDVDFNLKLREKGYYNVFLPMAKVYHLESKSRGTEDTPVKKARFDQEQRFMYKKWAEQIGMDEFYNPNFSRNKAYRLMRGDRSVIDRVIGVPKALVKRAKEPWRLRIWERTKIFEEAKRDGKKVALYYTKVLESTTFRYRCYNVIQATLKSKKWQAVFFREDEMSTIEELMPRADLLVLGRQCEWSKDVGHVIGVAKKAKVPVVFDLDDLIFDKKYLDVVTSTINEQDNLKTWEKLFERVHKTGEEVDGFITTNNFLAERMEKTFDKPCKVIRNSLNDEQIKISKMFTRNKQNKTRDNFIIGYFGGTPTHAKDFGVALPDVLKFLEEHDDVKLRIVGFVDLDEKIEELMEAGKIELRELANFRKLQGLIADVDVNIAPLLVNEFTNCKSELKFFESAIVDTTTIASPTYVFEKCIDDKRNGLLARPGEWHEKINYLYENPEENRRMAKRAHKDAMKHYYGKEFLDEIEKVYDELIEEL